MNRQAIATAQSLFYERDRLQKLSADAARAGGFTVAILGNYQDDEIKEAALRPVLELISKRIKRIEGDLKQLGWDGR